MKDKFGLKPDRLTILFSSGSFGIGPTEAVLHSFHELGHEIQILVVCGNNQKLFEKLTHRRFSFPLILFGFVDNMPEIMSVSDLLIAKSGGATTCESLAKKLPMVILSPIPGQERYNAQWLIKRKAAFEIEKPSEIKNLVLRIIAEPASLDFIRQSIEKIAKPNAASDLADFVLSQAKQLS